MLALLPSPLHTWRRTGFHLSWELPCAASEPAALQQACTKSVSFCTAELSRDCTAPS